MLLTEKYREIKEIYERKAIEIILDKKEGITMIDYWKWQYPNRPVYEDDTVVMINFFKGQRISWAKPLYPASQVFLVDKGILLNEYLERNPTVATQVEIEKRIKEIMKVELKKSNFTVFTHQLLEKT